MIACPLWCQARLRMISSEASNKHFEGDLLMTRGDSVVLRRMLSAWSSTIYRQWSGVGSPRVASSPSTQWCQKHNKSFVTFLTHSVSTRQLANKYLQRVMLPCSVIYLVQTTRTYSQSSHNVAAWKAFESNKNRTKKRWIKLPPKIPSSDWFSSSSCRVPSQVRWLLCLGNSCPAMPCHKARKEMGKVQQSKTKH